MNLKAIEGHFLLYNFYIACRTAIYQVDDFDDLPCRII